MTHRHGSPWPGARKCKWASAVDSLFRVCLTITNTLFKQPEIHTVTWMHPRSKHWHLIDYIITRHRDIRDITWAMRGVDCWTDHVLLQCRAAF